jgi:DNA-binding MarR family transcriptional regulator
MVEVDQTVEADRESVPPHHSAEEILSHPRFPFARDEFLKAMLALYEHDPFLNRLLLESGRTVLFINILCLHARYDVADRATWPTLRLVTESMTVYGLASPSRVYDLVTRLITTGYLEQHASRQDRRIRILTPTAKMIAQDQDFLVSHYLPLAILFPEPGYPRIVERDPAFQSAHRSVSGNLFALGAQILASSPITMLFGTREAGMMVLIKLLQTAGPAGDAAFSYSDIGARFGVSRTHVRKLLKEAEVKGFVHLASGGGQLVQVMPALVQAFDRFLADVMAGHDMVYNLTLRPPA